MKILHIGKYYPPVFGGIETVTQLLASGISAFNHRAAVICFSKNCPSVQIDRNKNIVIYNCRQLFKLFSQPFGFQYIFSILKLKNKYDIIHLHYPNIIGALCILFFTKTKIVIHWHSDVLKNPLLKAINSIIDYFLLIKADYIVVTSENYAKSSYSLQKFLHKVSIIPIGIHDHSNVEFEQHKIIKYDDLLKSKFVLSVGRLVNYKGFDYLIESFIDTPEDLKLIIIGNGPLRNQLINMINSKKLTHKVFILSDIDPGFLHLFYKSATLFCLPSITRAEAYGVVLVEALSYGLPIVATNINGSGVTFVNRHKITGINVPPKDSQSLALAISRIANSDRLQQYFSIKSRHVFLSTFTAMIFVSRTLNLYEDLFHKSE